MIAVKLEPCLVLAFESGAKRLSPPSRKWRWLSKRGVSPETCFDSIGVRAYESWEDHLARRNGDVVEIIEILLDVMPGPNAQPFLFDEV